VVEAAAPALPPGEPYAFALIWVDEQWQAGLDLLKQVQPLELRARCVLIGREPPADIGPQLRAAGALTYLHSEFPGWLIAPLRAALGRMAAFSNVPSYALLRALRGPVLQRESAILDSVLRLAEELFHTDQVKVLVRKRPDAPLYSLQSCGESVQLVACDSELSALFDAAAHFGDQLALPSVVHARLAPKLLPLASDYQGAAAIACDIGSDLQAAIVLLWRDRFLLNPVEVASLDALALLAGAAWSHLTLSMALPRAASVVRAVEQAGAATRSTEFQRELLRTMAELTGVHGALLVLRDAEEEPERLHIACDWFEPGFEPAQRGHLNVYCAQPSTLTPEAYRDALQLELTQRGSALQVLECLLLPGCGAVLLLDHPALKQHCASLRFQLLLSAAKQRLPVVFAALSAQHRQRAEASVDRFSALAAVQTKAGLHDALKDAVQLVSEIMGAEQVFLQYGGEIVSVPDSPEAQSILAIETSLTRFVKKSGKMARILNVEDGERQSFHQLDHAALAASARALHREHLRSVIICPIGEGIGVLKIITSDQGPFLTSTDAELAGALARKLSELTTSVLRAEMLRSLHQLMGQLAGFSGQELAAALVRDFESWCARFLRPNAQVFIRARDGFNSVLLEGASPSMSKSLQAALEARPTTECSEHLHLLHAPLFLAHAGLQGDLYVASHQRFPSYGAEYLLDAAREISLLLNTEYVRHELRKQSGVFRHGLLGPIQGLSSSAKLLEREVQQSGLELAPKLQRCVRDILSETQKINQWRERHRLFASFQEHKRIDLRRTNHDLRELVETCARRFDSAMAERQLRLVLRLPRGPVVLRFDPYALDMALSNVLDNAVKYAFFNRDVTVGLQPQRHAAEVWVEDIGHDIPADRAQQIYLPGGRGELHDPLRVIHGEGLGLYIARAIARAHGGDLTHSVRCEGHEINDKTPYRVRFTLTLTGG
jgi:signal transduction histidine kinase